MATANKATGGEGSLSLLHFTFNGVTVKCDMGNPEFFKHYLACADKVPATRAELKEAGVGHQELITKLYRSFFNDLLGNDTGDKMLPDISALEPLLCFEHFEAFVLHQTSYMKESARKLRATQSQSKKNKKQIQDAMKAMESMQ